MDYHLQFLNPPSFLIKVSPPLHLIMNFIPPLHLFINFIRPLHLLIDFSRFLHLLIKIQHHNHDHKYIYDTYFNRSLIILVHYNFDNYLNIFNLKFFVLSLHH